MEDKQQEYCYYCEKATGPLTEFQDMHLCDKCLEAWIEDFCND